MCSPLLQRLPAFRLSFSCYLCCRIKNQRVSDYPLSLVITVLLILWLLVVGIQLVYILFVYSRTALYRQPKPNERVRTVSSGESSPGVSIVVCARNEIDNLTELLPLLNAQHYPAFEVLVMDDRSTDGTGRFLENDITHLERVRFIRIDKEYEHITPKKYALTIALKKVKYPTVLLTDADCRPASDGWLAGYGWHHWLSRKKRLGWDFRRTSIGPAF